ncbi:hypothetical protein Pmani_024509 [Petrolisthes manimaculis]|uniref:Uncharacterized protein n=1 Tax=Petrolisthes manimaculis TaxID=1843537 RepID=A0AAE1U258_9EUCA|nr:hypothetical protein Pmani_024509 [Petrolisthes manimaculis]
MVTKKGPSINPSVLVFIVSSSQLNVLPLMSRVASSSMDGFTARDRRGRSWVSSNQALFHIRQNNVRPGSHPFYVTPCVTPASGRIFTLFLSLCVCLSVGTSL